MPVVEALVRAHPDLSSRSIPSSPRWRGRRSTAGAAIVNDVTALPVRSRRWPAWSPARGAGAILMHSRGGLLEIASYEHADYGGDVVGGVLARAAGRAGRGHRRRRGAGRDRARPRVRVLQDGGAERRAASISSPALQALGRPLLVGPSRKRFLGAVTGLPVDERDRATAAACALAWERGARLFRVHAVRGGARSARPRPARSIPPPST